MEPPRGSIYNTVPLVWLLSDFVCRGSLGLSVGIKGFGSCASALGPQSLNSKPSSPKPFQVLSLASTCWAPAWAFPRIRGTFFLGIPKIRMIVFGGLYRGPATHGIYHFAA